MAHDVFISHANRDKAVADAVCAALEGRGLRCWYAPRDVPAGEPWAEALMGAIGKLFLWAPEPPDLAALAAADPHHTVCTCVRQNEQ